MIQVVSTGGQVISGNQIVVTNANLAQQLATGKAQLTTIGGHQVVIRSTPTGNQIVHLNSSNSGIIVKNAASSTKQGRLKFRVLKTWGGNISKGEDYLESTAMFHLQ